MSEALEAYRYAKQFNRRAVLIFSVDSHGRTYAATYAADPLIAEAVDDMENWVLGEDAFASEKCQRLKQQLMKEEGRLTNDE